jgi:gluconate 5-dehydrogenase
MELRLDGRCALITGGGSGIGYAVAEAFGSSGARTIIAGRRKEVLDDAAERLPGEIIPQQLDVRDSAESTRILEDLNERYGPITILVNNAGIHLKKSGEDTTVEEFQSVLNTHVLGAHALTRVAIPRMRSAGGGSVLFVASMAALFGIPYVTAYSAAKSAYLGMARTLATEYGQSNIRFNVLAPGWIDSEMMRGAVEKDPARKEKILGRTPLGRFGTAEEVASAALFLSSDAARFVTGVCLPIDGGAAIGF